MDKTATGNGQQVKSNSRYQKDMEKSFAVIYHNLKRIQEDRESQHRWVRRNHSEPQIQANNPALLRKNKQTPNRERSQSVPSGSPDPKDNKRRVSFCDSVNRIPH